MNAHPVRHFKLLAPGHGRGVSCDANGAFVDSVPLLKRLVANGKGVWAPRACDELSKELGSRYGLPIDVSSKASGIAAIARALNARDLVRAQLVTLYLRFPQPPLLAKRAPRKTLIKFIRELYESGLIKAVWDPDEHPRWPGGAPDNQGGRFVLRGSAPSEPPGIGHNGGPPLEAEEAAAEEDAATALGAVGALATAVLLLSTGPAGSAEEDEAVEQIHMHHPWPKYLGGAEDQILTPLPKSVHMEYHNGAQEFAPHAYGKDFYENMTPQARAKLYDQLAKYTKQFDEDHDTTLYDDLIRNGFPVTR